MVLLQSVHTAVSCTSNLGNVKVTAAAQVVCIQKPASINKMKSICNENTRGFLCPAVTLWMEKEFASAGACSQSEAQHPFTTNGHLQPELQRLKSVLQWRHDSLDLNHARNKRTKDAQCARKSPINSPPYVWEQLL